MTKLLQYIVLAIPAMSQKEKEREDKVVRVQVQMSESTRNKFKSVTAAKGQTMNEVILNFVEDYIEEGEKPGDGK